jgi:DNA-binding transcriptional MerR regulator
MNTATIARLIDVSPDTVRRWCDTRDYYGAFLSSGATPGDGFEREFNRHDLRVLHYVATGRSVSKTPHDQIKSALTVMRSNDYAELPDVPDQWIASPQDGRIAVNEASEQASQLAELTALQIINQTLRERLVEAAERAESLQRELNHLKATQSATESQVHSLEVELERVRGEVSALQARLASYSLTGDRPIPLVILLAITALAVTVLVIVLLVVVRLVL